MKGTSNIPMLKISMMRLNGSSLSRILDSNSTIKRLSQIKREVIRMKGVNHPIQRGKRKRRVDMMISE